jgi:hypothetical protein
MPSRSEFKSGLHNKGRYRSCVIPDIWCWTSHCLTGIADIRCQRVNIYNVLILCGTKGSMGNLGNGQQQQDGHYGLRHMLVPWLSPAIARSVPITNNSSTKRSCSRLQHRYKATRKLATSRSVKHKVKKNCVATKKPAKKISQWTSAPAAILMRYITHNEMYLIFTQFMN